MSSSTTTGGRNPVEALAEEFLERKRRGEPATPEEYAAAHPELADEILALFPALLMMEDLAGDSGGETGSVTSAAGAVAGVSAGRLGEFRLLREVGRGGMGVVYEAEQESLGRRVALKVLPAAALVDSKQVRRFEREARSAARLHHTNIVPVFGVGQHEGTHFYVMQFIQGQGLDAVLSELKRLRDSRAAGPAPPARELTAARIARQRDASEIARSLATGQFAAGLGSGEAPPASATLPWTVSGPQAALSGSSFPGLDLSSPSTPSGVSTLPETDRRFAQGVARVGTQVAEALAYAHGQGILHRDIKPSNLLLDRAGNVWVADFGLAKAVGTDDLTHTGDILGTVRYMAPERFRGEGDARADIYALGLTLYELLALRPAYEEKDRASLIRQVTQEDPPRLRRLNHRVPGDLETIVHKSIAREPGQRYPSARAMADDLNRFLEGRPIVARRVSPAERAWRWCRRNPWLAGLSAALLLALVTGTIVASVLAAKANRQAAVAAAEADRARRLAADLQASLGRSNKLAGDLTTTLEISERRLKALNLERARTTFERGRAACDRGDIGPGLLYLVEAWRSAVDAGDPELAHAARASLSAWRFEAPRLLQQFAHSDKDAVRIVALSPDARLAATRGNDNQVRVWNAATGDPIGSPLPQDGPIYPQAFSPDGKLLLTGDFLRARIWDLATGTPAARSLEDASQVVGIAFSSDGRTILTASVRKPAQLWDAASGHAVGKPLTQTDSSFAVAFSPDSRTIVTGGGDSALHLWDAATGQPIGQPMKEPGRVYALAFSADGKTLITGGSDHMARLWDVATGSPIGQPLKHQGVVYEVAFGADGNFAVTGAAERVRVWDVATGQGVATPLADQGYLWSRAFRSDGGAVLSADGDGTARLWDITIARPIGRPLTHGSRVDAVAFHPDGKTVLTGGADGTVRAWDAATGRALGLRLLHRGAVYALAYGPGGKTVLTGSTDETARIWDAATGRPIGPALRHRYPVRAVAYSPDGKTVFTGNYGEAQLWDAATGKPLGPALLQRYTVNAVCYSPDGKTVLTGGYDRTARFWDVATGRPIGEPLVHQGAVHSVAFSPDGRRALTGSANELRLWDAATRRPIGPALSQREGFRSATFSPDGRRILAGSGDSMARLWDTALAQPIGPPLAHRGEVKAVAFSPDGRTAVCAGGNEALLWDVSELPDDLPRFDEWAQVTTGLGLDEQGQVKRRDASAWRDHRDRLAALGGAPETQPRWRLDPVLFGPEPTARAKGWVEQKRWAQAEAAFNAAVAARPFDAAVRFERARFYASRSQPQKAEDDYARSYWLGERDAKLTDAIVASEPLYRRVVAESPDSAAPLLAKHGRIMLSRSRWDEAAADFSRELALAPANRNWDSDRSARAMELLQWPQVYSRILKLRPDDGHLFCVRGRYHALRDHWDRAAADFARGVRSAPPRSEEWFEHACLRLKIGDSEGYRAAVRELTRRSGSAEDPFTAFVVARTTAIAADPGVEPAQIIHWAERAVADHRYAWYVHALGLALYRAGRFDLAIRTLEESNTLGWDAAATGNLQNKFARAMAHHRLGHAAEARALLDQAERSIKSIDAARTDGAVAGAALDWLALQVLRREAEALILYDPAFPADPLAPGT